MSERHIRHRIERTRNKHSRAVFAGDTIIIRLAKNLTKKEEVHHIEDLLDRMHKMIGREKLKTIISPFDDLLRGKDKVSVTLQRGKSYTFELAAGRSLKATETPNGWMITVGPRTRRKALHQLLWKCLSQSEMPYMEALIDEINDETLKVDTSAIRLKIATTQWGSCSIQGAIMINTALLFVPPPVLRYVIVHELAHRLHHDHSPAYWSNVERVMEDYKAKRAELLEYRLPIL